MAAGSIALSLLFQDEPEAIHDDVDDLPFTTSGHRRLHRADAWRLHVMFAKYAPDSGTCIVSLSRAM
jgi:hypothetical protein